MSAIIFSFTSVLLFLVSTLFTGTHARCSHICTVSIDHSDQLVKDDDNNVWIAPEGSYSKTFDYPGGSIGAVGSFGTGSERLAILSNQPVKMVREGETPEGFYDDGFIVDSSKLKWNGLSQFYACVPKNKPNDGRKAQLFWLDMPQDLDAFMPEYETCKEVDINTDSWGAAPPCILGYM